MGLIQVIQAGYDTVRVQEKINLLIQVIEDVIKGKKSNVMRVIN